MYLTWILIEGAPVDAAQPARRRPVRRAAQRVALREPGAGRGRASRRRRRRRRVAEQQQREQQEQHRGLGRARRGGRQGLLEQRVLEGVVRGVRVRRQVRVVFLDFF